MTRPFFLICADLVIFRKIPLLLSLPLLLSAAAGEVKKDNVLKLRVPYFRASAGSEFIRLCGQMRLPCGWERLPPDGNTFPNPNTFQKDRDLVVPEPKDVEFILSAIVSRYPQYEFSVTDGVINIHPRPEFATKAWYKSPLEKMISPFEIREAFLPEAGEKICEVGGLRDPAIHNQEIFSPFGAKYRKISLKIKSGTLREALDELVREDGSAMWILYPVRRKSFLWFLGPWIFSDKIDVIQE